MRASLAGKRVLVLRPEGQADDLAAALASRGAEPVVVPAIRILPPRDWGPVDDILRRADGFDWMVFTSVNGVASVLDRAAEGLPISAKIAAVGPVTRAALESRGVRVDWMPGRYTTRALAEEFPGPPSRALLVRAATAGPELEEDLRSRGFEVERIDAYRTEPINAARIREALGGPLDAILFTSASIVRAFVEAAGDPHPILPAVACIGPATAEACRELSLRVDVEAREHTTTALVAALERHLLGE